MTTLDSYKKFLSRFGPIHPRLLDNLAIDGNRMYYDPQEHAQWAKAKNISYHAVGQFLGEKKKDFLPSPFCIERLSTFARNDHKVVLGDKGSWLFLCARDVFGSEIVSGTPKFHAPVFVFDTQQNQLGYGEWLVDRFEKRTDNKVVLQHVSDRGEYIRRK